MPWLSLRHRPFVGFRLLRRGLAELRGIRLALERQAAVAELAQGQVQPRESLHAQVFRSHAKGNRGLDDQEVKDLTGVSYVDDQTLGVMLRHEDELRALLGRDPTEAEVERAYRGEIE